MSNVITISGWGQAYDALENVVPKNSHHLDYSNFKNVDEFFASIKGQSADAVVGWSLGGQLALRAISDGVLKTKSLVLLSTPYQFVASKDVKCAMDKDTFNTFHIHFQKDPLKTIKRFITLVSLNDSHAHEILTNLRHSVNIEDAEKWNVWLDELEHFSCHSIDFSQIPKTFAFHGRNDTIVDVAQTGFFKSLIRDYTLEIFDHCGHAPHLHNSTKVMNIIKAAL